MRARNIKPSLFKNEVLGTADPLLTILFEGLWCEADREGRLEDRPLRLKAEILPYRNDADIDAMLKWLSDHGFIARYEALGTKVIQVLKFSEHQRPHNNEVESVLPPMDAIKHNQGKKPAQPRKKTLSPKEESTSLLMLDTDSGSLIPDPPKEQGARARALAVPGLDLKAWEEWQAYRAERKPAIKLASLVAAAEELAAFGDQQAIVVKHSVANGYQGLFAPKTTAGLNGVTRKPFTAAPTTAELEAQEAARGGR